MKFKEGARYKETCLYKKEVVYEKPYYVTNPPEKASWHWIKDPVTGERFTTHRSYLIPLSS